MKMRLHLFGIWLVWFGELTSDKGKRRVNWGSWQWIFQIDKFAFIHYKLGLLNVRSICHPRVSTEIDCYLIKLNHWNWNKSGKFLNQRPILTGSLNWYLFEVDPLQILINLPTIDQVYQSHYIGRAWCLQIEWHFRITIRNLKYWQYSEELLLTFIDLCWCTRGHNFYHGRTKTILKDPVAWPSRFFIFFIFLILFLALLILFTNARHLNLNWFAHLNTFAKVLNLICNPSLTEYPTRYLYLNLLFLDQFLHDGLVNLG